MTMQLLLRKQKMKNLGLRDQIGFRCNGCWRKKEISGSFGLSAPLHYIGDCAGDRPTISIMPLNQHMMPHVKYKGFSLFVPSYIFTFAEYLQT